MLKYAISFLVSVLLGFTLLFWAADQFAPSFQSCISEQANNNDTQTIKDDYSTIRVTVDSYTLCTARLVDTHAGLFTALASFIVAAFTGVLSVATAGLLKASGNQAEANERTIKEATKSSAAMTSVANSMNENVQHLKQTLENLKESVATTKRIADQQKIVSQLQLRAYLSVLIGEAIYQERDKGLHFEGRALLANQGATPAKRVVHKTQVGIFDVPLSKEFVLPALPEEAGGENMIGPHQNRTLSAILDHFCDDGEIENIKRGIGKGLYIWGKITYLDAFDDQHETNFCHLLTWRGDKIWGYFIPNRNSMT